MEQVRTAGGGEASRVSHFRHSSLLRDIDAQRVLLTTESRSNTETTVGVVMSRQSVAPQRNLSLTEELEKLEQSITLTLQGKHPRDYPTSATDNRRNRP
jgi:hypothetical protein